MKGLALLTMAALVPGFAVAASADDIYTRYFAQADGGKPCYARSYDRKHMEAHPKQTVRRIQVDFDKDFGEAAGPKNTASSFEAGIGFMLNRSDERYGDALYCKTLDNRVDCYLDADGGTIRLTPQGDALRLEVTGGGAAPTKSRWRDARISPSLELPATTTACSCYRAPIASCAGTLVDPNARTRNAGLCATASSVPTAIPAPRRRPPPRRSWAFWWKLG